MQSVEIEDENQYRVEEVPMNAQRYEQGYDGGDVGSRMVQNSKSVESKAYYSADMPRETSREEEVENNRRTVEPRNYHQ